MSDNIYSDGSYIEQNKTLHIEDSLHKFKFIKELIDCIIFSKKNIKVLDVGGGAGLVGKYVCEYLISLDYNIEFFALDLSLEMLEIQKKNNSNIKEIYNLAIEKINKNDFDLVLMIDVIEHIPEHTFVASHLNKISKNIIYNIPLEINVFDFLRNKYMKNNYYKMQTETIGHIHFFSYQSAIRFIKKYHMIKKYIFVDYASHILKNDSVEYNIQKSNKLRRLELKTSHFIVKYFKVLAPYLIQGSLFAIVERKNGKNYK